MKHPQYILLVLVAIFGIGCKAIPSVPLPPVYDLECQPSDSTYLEWAQDTQDLAKPGEIPSDPQAALDKAKQWISDKGVGIIEKLVTGKGQLDKFTTTLPENIYVKPGFWDTETSEQASTLWHEMVHVRQWKRLGPQEMAIRWGVYAEGRWSLETVAYRESFRVMRLFGKSEDQLHDYAPKRASDFYDAYALAGMPKQCMIETTSKIWLMDGG